MYAVHCPNCDDEHDLPDDCEYGGTFIAPCGIELDVEYDETYDEESGDQFEWRIAHIARFCERCGANATDYYKPSRTHCDTCIGERERGLWR